jgi:hypothetical protein
MSSINGNGKANLLISYLFPENTNTVEQIDLENTLKKEISEVLNKHGLKFVIADDELISQKLLE